MLQTLGRKIYFNKATGEIVYNTGERSGTDIIPTTIEEDFEYAFELQGKTPAEIGILELEVGELIEDFNTCLTYRVNTETKELEFSFSNDDSDGHALYEESYNTRLARLEQKNQQNLQRIADLELMLAKIKTV